MCSYKLAILIKACLYTYSMYVTVRGHLRYIKLSSRCFLYYYFFLVGVWSVYWIQKLTQENISMRNSKEVEA